MYTVVDQGRRRCTVCRQNKSVSDFYRYSYRTKQGILKQRSDSRCRPCAKARRLKRDENKVQIEKENARKWRVRNPEACERYRKAYQASEHGKCIKARLQRNRKHRLRARGTYSETDLREILKTQKGRCAGCSCDMGGQSTIDHIMPVSLGGTNLPRNLQFLCRRCNSRKGAKHPLEWYRENGFLL